MNQSWKVLPTHQTSSKSMSRRDFIKYTGGLGLSLLLSSCSNLLPIELLSPTDTHTPIPPTGTSTPTRTPTQTPTLTPSQTLIPTNTFVPTKTLTPTPDYAGQVAQVMEKDLTFHESQASFYYGNQKWTMEVGIDDANLGDFTPDGSFDRLLPYNIPKLPLRWSWNNCQAS